MMEQIAGSSITFHSFIQQLFIKKIACFTVLLLYCASQICRYCVFEKWKVCGNVESSKSTTGPVFAMAFAHFVSLSCFVDFQNIPKF